MGELLGAFAFASDLAFGLELEDSLRSCYIATRLAEELGMPEEQRIASYYASLFKDAGCTSWTSVFAAMLRTDEITARKERMIFGLGAGLPSKVAWARRNLAAGLGLGEHLKTYFDFITRFNGVLKEGYVTACAVSARIADRMGMPATVQDGILHLFEHWDGSGQPEGLRGEEISPVSRVVLPAFLLAPLHRAGGRETAIDVALKQRGKAFDPAVADAFLALASQDDFWRDMEEAPILEVILRLEPDTALATVDEGRFDEVAMAFADFIDLKSPYLAAHSRRVAAIAKRTAALMGCSEQDQRLIYRTALLHDLGLVAVPSYYLDKPEDRLSESEREAMRLHPYHAERVLNRVGAMAVFTPAVGAHHERFDGSGYFRGLKGKDIPLAARIIAVADRLDDLTHDHPARSGLSLDEAMKAVSAESGTAFDPDVVFAVAGGLGAVAAPSTPAQWPAGLTDREVEVLRIASQGLTRRDIGKRLGITENTVRHHLEHIYNKAGTSGRVGATLFAMEHDLLP